MPRSTLSKRLAIFCLSLLVSLIYHGLNHGALHSLAPDNLRKGVSVATADDPSYLAPAENALTGKGWRSNAIGRAAWLSRTPGYGLMYAFWRAWLPERYALYALLFFQICLWAWALSFVPAITESWNIRGGFCLAILMAVLPTFGGFLSYTLTEGVTPTLVLLFVASLSGSSFDRFPWKPTAVAAIILIIRPSLLPICLALPIYILLKKTIFIESIEVRSSRRSRRHVAFRQTIFATLFMLLPLLSWQAYISIRTGSLQGIHPIYQSDAADLYRPLHGEIWNFHKSWGDEGQDFHRRMNRLWAAAYQNLPSRSVADSVVSSLPTAVVGQFGRDSLARAYVQYVEVLKQQQVYFNQHLPIDKAMHRESDLESRFSAWAASYRNAHFFHYWFIDPAKVFVRLAVHSNLNLYLFQGAGRGSSPVEIVRMLSFIVHLGVFCLFPFSIYYLKRRPAALPIALGMVAYLAYLIFIQRGVEERYTAPVLPVMSIFAFALITSGVDSIWGKRKMKNL